MKKTSSNKMMCNMSTKKSRSRVSMNLRHIARSYSFSASFSSGLCGHLLCSTATICTWLPKLRNQKKHYLRTLTFFTPPAGQGTITKCFTSFLHGRLWTACYLRDLRFHKATSTQRYSYSTWTERWFLRSTSSVLDLSCANGQDFRCSLTLWLETTKW